MKIERRSIPLELRAKDDEPKISGYSILFNTLSENLGGFREQISGDANIEFDDTVALFNHDSNFVLGRTASNTLKLTRDKKGVHMEVEPPDTTWARDLMVSMKRGDIDKQSFAFYVLPDGQSWDEDPDTGALIRTVKSMRVVDVSVVTRPAYTQTDAHVRSMSEILSDAPAKEDPTIETETLISDAARSEPQDHSGVISAMFRRYESTAKFD